MQFNGSPAIVGGDLVFENGQPIMDTGISTSVTTSLLTRQGWWGEIIAPLAGGYVEASESPITSAMLDNLEAVAESSLSWIRRQGLASTISATCTNPVADEVQTVVEIDGQVVTV